jgi:hypothetical protein
MGCHDAVSRRLLKVISTVGSADTGFNGELSPSGRDQFDPRGKSVVGCHINRPVALCVGRRVVRSIIVSAPIGNGPYRPPLKTAAAIWADIVQNLGDAICTVGALERTDACILGMGRERLCTMLADGAKFQQVMNVLQLHTVI